MILEGLCRKIKTFYPETTRKYMTTRKGILTEKYGFLFLKNTFWLRKKKKQGQKKFRVKP